MIGLVIRWPRLAILTPASQPWFGAVFVGTLAPQNQMIEGSVTTLRDGQGDSPDGVTSLPLFRRRMALSAATAVLVGLAAVVVVVQWGTPKWGDWPGSDRPEDCEAYGSDLRVCASPSKALTSDDVISLLQSACPSLKGQTASALVPQSIHEDLVNSMKVTAQGGLAASGTAVVDGASWNEYREDAVVGTSAEAAKLSRYVGGSNAGLLEVDCPGDDPLAPHISLKPDQVMATFAAQDGSDTAIDFTQVFQVAVTEMQEAGLLPSGSPQGECSTAGTNVQDVEQEGLFSCSLMDWGTFQTFTVLFRVSAGPPHFEVVRSGLDEVEMSQSPSGDDTGVPPSPTPKEPATPSGDPDCSELNEVNCQMAQLIVRRCPAEPQTVKFVRATSIGMTRFTYLTTGTGAEATAWASGEYQSGAFVQSCGHATNGVDVAQAHSAIIQQARTWIDPVVAVTCHSKRPMDELPVGSQVPCDVWDDSGYPNPAKVSITNIAPYFVATLSFGD